MRWGLLAGGGRWWYKLAIAAQLISGKHFWYSITKCSSKVRAFGPKAEVCGLSQCGEARGAVSYVTHYLPAPGSWPIRALPRHSNRPITGRKLGHVTEHPIIDLRSGWRSSSSGCTGRGRGAWSSSRWATGRTRCTRPSWPSRPSATTVGST